MTEYLTPYSWTDHVRDIYPRYEGDIYIPATTDPRRRFFSRIKDKIIFFKTESDMIAFDYGNEPWMKYEHIKQRAQYLVGQVEANG